MKVLPIKIKQRLLVKLLEDVINLIPQLLKIIVMSIIGMCLNLSPILITVIMIVGNIKIVINISDSKKTE